jgi:hypothetical protein
VGEDSAEEQARIADEARRKVLEAEAITTQQLEAQAGRARADALTGEGGEEAVRQNGLIYGGLIGIAVVMVQGFLEAPSDDRGLPSSGSSPASGTSTGLRESCSSLPGSSPCSCIRRDGGVWSKISTRPRAANPERTAVSRRRLRATLCASRLTLA